jgi:XapX domain-containing protein
MKSYFISLGAGLLVGIVYNLIHVRSPAPPLVALVGLLGILLGEQVIPVGRQILAGEPFGAACSGAQTVAHLLGELPGHHRNQPPKDQAPEPRS